MTTETDNLAQENEALKGRVQELEKENAKLKAKLGRNSTNSSRPPSSDNPKARAIRKKKRRSARRQGAQKGHKPSHRQQMMPDKIIAQIPSQCQHCQSDLHGLELNPVVHQIIDIPPIKPVVTDYHLHRLTCSCCQKTTRGQLPYGMPNVHFGFQFRALLSTLVGAYRLSRRQAQRFANHICQVPISLGSVSNMEKLTTKALKPCVEQVAQHLRQGEHLHFDETGFPIRPGSGGQLWVATEGHLSLFLVHPSRGKVAFKTLLGDFDGLLTSDRFSTYKCYDFSKRQFCLAHLLRDFQGLADRGGKAGKVGQGLVNVLELGFRCLRWDRQETVKMGPNDRKWLGEHMRLAVRQFLTDATQLARPPSWAKTLLEQEDAMWRWVDNEGMDLTNNPAERSLRHGVLLRKVCFFVQSLRGADFVAFILTCVQSLRAQARDTFSFLKILLNHELDTPSLLPIPS